MSLLDPSISHARTTGRSFSRREEPSEYRQRVAADVGHRGVGHPSPHLDAEFDPAPVPATDLVPAGLADQDQVGLQRFRHVAGAESADFLLYRCRHVDVAGRPPAGGDEAGDRLAHSDDVDGVTFTGSYDVGMYLYRTVAASRPKPVVCEMGGKNPAVVTASADLDLAAEGVMRAAFGLSGQKCSANSRVYVERPAFEEFVDLLTQKTAEIEVGDPRQRDIFLGPVIDQEAVERFRSAVAEVKEAGGEVLAGGEVVTDGDLARGNFLQPTVVTAPQESWVWEKELFVPFVAVTAVDSLDEGIDKSNDTIFGLTAGVFAGTDEEVDLFFQRIQAGVVYANRRAGSTTGAWPDIQPFGGWKGSGTSGAGSGGPWYMRSYVREQARTLIRE